MRMGSAMGLIIALKPPMPIRPMATAMAWETLAMILSLPEPPEEMVKVMTSVLTDHDKKQGAVRKAP